MTLSFTQVKEWYPTAISGTSVSAMNVFLFLGASALTTLGSILIRTYDRDIVIEDCSLVWGIMFIMTIIAVLMIFLSKEKKEGDRFFGVQ